MRVPVASPLRTASADWRRYAGSAYRPFHAIGISQGAVFGLAGGAVTTPLLLTLGAPPPLTLAIGMLSAFGSLAQLGVPWLLRRTDGNLRGLTLLLAAVGDTRGFVLAAVVALTAVGLVGHGVAIAAIAVISFAAATCTNVAQSNVQAWFHAVMPEPERRFVAPRIGTTGAILSVALLLSTAALLHDPRLGLWGYLPPLLIAGVASLIGIAGLRRLERPGRVLVPERLPSRGASADTGSAALSRLLRVSSIGAVGFGIGPPLSIYAIAVLGQSAGFAVLLSAIGTVTGMLASMAASTMLARGSSARMLRGSFIVRSLAMGLAVLALPGNPLAPLLVVGVVVLGAAGDSFGTLASTERLFRLATGPAAISHQARFVVANSLSTGGAQLVASAVLAVGASAGYPAYALLFGASVAARGVAAWRLDVTPSPVRAMPAVEPLVAEAA